MKKPQIGAVRFIRKDINPYANDPRNVYIAGTGRSAALNAFHHEGYIPDGYYVWDDLNRRQLTSPDQVEWNDPDAKPSLTEHEVLILRTAVVRRIEHLKKAISNCTGTLYPAIYANEATDLADVFEKVTGQPLNPKDTAEHVVPVKETT